VCKPTGWACVLFLAFCMAAFTDGLLTNVEDSTSTVTCDLCVNPLNLFLFFLFYPQESQKSGKVGKSGGQDNSEHEVTPGMSQDTSL